MRVEGAGVNRISAEGALGDGPEPGEPATSDRQCFLAGGSPALKDLFVVDGGTQCSEGTPPCRVICFVVLAAGVLLPVAVAPAFHFFPRGLCGDRGEWNTARRKRHSRRSANWGNGRADRT